MLSTCLESVETTPAFVLDMDRVAENLRPLLALRDLAGCHVLYSIKALPLGFLMESLRGRVDGFSVSSLFEARWAHEILGGSGTVHLTSPGLRPAEIAELRKICTHISFNSLSQYQRLADNSLYASKGLRINPKLSFIDDPRFDPCRPHSKLGVDVAELSGGLPPGIKGLHVHNVFDSPDFTPLMKTLAVIQPLLMKAPTLHWLNLGGGYRYRDAPGQLIQVLRRLRESFGLSVFLEPGKALVGDAGYLVTTVLDRFDSDGKTVLIVDTSINHHPEVFEYQRQPRLLNGEEFGLRTAIVAGSTCLAGDLFGEYRFKRVPDVGDKLVFAELGAYSLIKANRFNGYNLPDVYSLSAGSLQIRQQYAYDAYREQWQSANCEPSLRLTD